jgi:hypothetical protein
MWKIHIITVNKSIAASGVSGDNDVARGAKGAVSL